MKFVDDITTGTRSLLQDGQSHITQGKEKKLIHAEGLEQLFHTVKAESERVGMKINDGKTQLLCMSQARNYDVSAFIRVGDEEVHSSNKLKILGFTLGTRGDMCEQVKAMKKSFAGTVWTLRHLKKAGITNQKLTLVYNSYIRPTIEYASVVYNSMISGGQSEEIERLQMMALKTIWGWNRSYSDVLEEAGIPRLDARRQAAVDKFAKKAAESDRYGGWFPLNQSLTHDLRHRDKYATDFARHERLKNAPIYAMRRRLNVLDNNDTTTS